MATIFGSTNSPYWTFKFETSEGAYSIPNNTSPLTVKVYIGRTSTAGGSYMQGADINITVGCTGCTAQQTRYRNTGRVDIAAGGWLLVGTVTFGAVPHNPDGNKIAYVTAEFTQSVVSPTQGNAGGYVTLASIPRQAFIQSAPSYFTDESELSFTFTKDVEDYADSLEACISYDEQERDIKYRPVSGGAYTFKFTSAEQTALQKWVLNGKTTITAYLYLRTEIGGVYYYDSNPLELEIVNCTPEFYPNIIDTNDATTNLTGNPLIIVRHKSVVSVTSGATAKKHATITSQFIRAGGQTLNSGSGTLTGLTNGFFEFKATDNRGVMGSHDLLVDTFVDYSEVTCKQNVLIGLDDEDNTTATARVTLSGAYFNGSFGESDNYLTLYYRIKELNTNWSTQEQDGWKEITDAITKSDGTYTCDIEIAGLDYMKDYVIQCRAQDALSFATSPEYNAKTRPVFDWGERDFKFNVQIYDEWGTELNNGKARYTGSGDNAIDPNTTIDHLILTNVNVPKSGYWYYVKTEFYSDKTPTSNRTQFALPYTGISYSPQYRAYYNGTWSEWAELVTMNSVWPVGSIHIRYDHIDPKTLFGGTWERISNRFLWATTSGGIIGRTGGSDTTQVALTLDNIPPHDHGSTYTGLSPTKNYAWLTGTGSNMGYAAISRGNGEPFDVDIMPPYIQVSVWRRTA